MLGIVFVLIYGMSLASISQKLMSIPTIFFIGITGTVGQELKNMYSFQHVVNIPAVICFAQKQHSWHFRLVILSFLWTCMCFFYSVCTVTSLDLHFTYFVLQEERKQASFEQLLRVANSEREVKLKGRYKSRTRSTRTASPGRIDSDQLGSNKKIKIK